MITKDEFESLYQDALERVMERGMDVNDLTNVFEEIVNEKRKLEQVREIIENRGSEQAGRTEQVSKQDRELALKQAMMNWDE